MEAIQAYYDGNTFVPLAPVGMKPNQQVTVAISDNSFPILESQTFWDYMREDLLAAEERRLAGERTYSLEEVWDEVEAILNDEEI